MDTLAAWALEHGLWGLGLLAFLAATLLPFSSEVALGAAIRGGMDPVQVVAVCSVGNVLACVVNYGLGRWGRERVQPKLEASWGGRRALAWTDRYGPWSLLGSWLPVVGDPLTIAAGVARVPWPLALGAIAALRIARYIALAAGLAPAA